jgi:purine-binding chemotaxis protein CheW
MNERPVVVVPVVVGEQRWALPVGAVERVVAMVAVAALPDSPAAVRGAINVGGEAVGVLDLELRLGRPRRERGADGLLVLVRTRRRRIALPVDEVRSVITIDPAAISPADSPAIPPPVAGLAALPDGVLLITDVDAFLSAAEDAALAAALEGAAT